MMTNGRTANSLARISTHQPRSAKWAPESRRKEGIPFLHSTCKLQIPLELRCVVPRGERGRYITPNELGSTKSLISSSILPPKPTKTSRWTTRGRKPRRRRFDGRKVAIMRIRVNIRGHRARPSREGMPLSDRRCLHCEDSVESKATAVKALRFDPRDQGIIHQCRLAARGPGDGWL